MSRSGYIDDCDNQWAHIRWRGAVTSAINGRRGQAFLKEMLGAMDALPEHKLIAHDLEKDGEACAIGTVGKSRGVSMSNIDPEDSTTVAALFGISEALAREIVFMNDEGSYYNETAEARYERMRKWAESNLLRHHESSAGGR